MANKWTDEDAEEAAWGDPPEGWEEVHTERHEGGRWTHGVTTYFKNGDDFYFVTVDVGNTEHQEGEGLTDHGPAKAEQKLVTVYGPA